ncbi:beta-ketoacyl-ACP synthase II [Ligilactobacillus faecis]|uniref:beta-ketoacyl-ACP synthase II n=1 Tax=Ligilactobacillus faecis TaxID=762833 RepID=UPI0024692B1A|nr:beta-ketoacyl-ACP synthase II [Ligilactobacillus faecis]WGN89102.1 beta-ketoacyl-ACP synthase II [Ligilactobacillus faecis]
MTRVVVTGMGAVMPLGNDLKEFRQNLFAGHLGIGPITKFDATTTGITNAGEVKNFDVSVRLGKKAAKRMDLFSQYAVDSALQAVEQAQITPENTAAKDLGVIFSSGIGGLTTIQEQVIKMQQKGPRKVTPLFVPTAIINMAAGNIALRIGAKNICTAVVTACASGTNAIGEAYRQIKEGRAQVMVTGGAEASINEIGIAGFAALTALSPEIDPAKASLPFDKKRSGFVMGEGSGALVLESLEHAKKRGASILGEIVGYGSNCDAYHITAPDPNGTGAIEAMRQALAEANLEPEKIDHINAHGTATKANDTAEAQAIAKVFGENSVLVSSTKAMTGHLLGASGAVEAIAVLLSLAAGQLPLNLGLKEQDPECPVTLVTKENKTPSRLEYALSNSLGFGGHNAVLAFKKWGED